MNAWLPYIIFGITSGAVYAISAMGLVLTYKTSGMFNFGHGAVCAAAAYAFYAFRQQHGLAWPIAAVLAVLVFGVIAGLILERIASLLSNVHTSYKIVGTVGILVMIQAMAYLFFSTQGLAFDPFLPESPLFQISGVAVGWEAVVDLTLGVGAAIALYIFFKSTRLGIAMRGVVDDPQLLDMIGTSPMAVRRSAWVIGSVFAAASGVLFASTQAQLDVNILSLLVVQAFGAAAIARFSSLPMCLAGGLIVGLIQKVISKEVAVHPVLQGLDLNVPFLVLFVLLLVMPRGSFAEVGRTVKARATAPSPFGPRISMAGYAALLLVALFVPQLVGARLPLYLTAMTQVVLFLSLGLLVRTSGQISLCHVGFAAIGACGFGHMLASGLPWGIALLLGGLFAIPAGALIAIPAIRLSGLYLGLATLGFGILLSQYAYDKRWMFGVGQLNTSRPHVFGFEKDKNFYYLLLIVALLAIALVVVIERSRLGRLLRGLSDSPVALTTLGLNINVSLVIVFCISTFLAGISGATNASLYASVNQYSFHYSGSLVALAVMAISGRRTLTVAVVAPILLYVVPGYIDDPKATWIMQIGFGFAAIVAAGLSQGAAAKFFDRQGAASTDRVVDPIFSARPTRRSSNAKRRGVWIPQNRSTMPTTNGRGTSSSKGMTGTGIGTNAELPAEVGAVHS